ncbi:F0F1 ATP synthase subunit A [Kiloniella sp. b19]|uniref:F0F1 ATP synthase subunit A n=1 Tax=Kiloniella sp. GXU_MW_B19 TaxID=3141326 RepID=UPI0031D89A9C
MDQFKISTLKEISVAGLDISFTNSAVFMVLAVALVSIFLIASTSGRALIPGRWQSAAEMCYELVANMLRDNVGSAGRAYFPFVFTVFMFILFGNLLGLIPGAFTFTSHIIVTFALAAVIFVGVTFIGFARHGFGFLRLFFPHGAPLWTAVILVPIELVSYLSRPISLSVRLFANMVVGHVLLKVIAGFVVLLGILGVVPLAFLVGITALEFLVAALQAYIFTILTCIYLHDAIHLH